MNNKIKIITMASYAFAITSSFAYPIVDCNRTKDRCGIGCASVKKTKKLADITTAEGKPGKGWVVDIQCFGAGLTHCPSSVAQENSDDQIETWSENIFNNLSEYAQNQISNGVNNGSRFFNYSLEDGSTRTLKVTWNAEVNLNSEVKSNISIIQI